MVGMYQSNNVVRSYVYNLNGKYHDANERTSTEVQHS